MTPDIETCYLLEAKKKALYTTLSFLSIISRKKKKTVENKWKIDKIILGSFVRIKVAISLRWRVAKKKEDM